jgi:hypothetical protein
MSTPDPTNINEPHRENWSPKTIEELRLTYGTINDRPPRPGHERGDTGPLPEEKIYSPAEDIPNVPDQFNLRFWGNCRTSSMISSGGVGTAWENESTGVDSGGATYNLSVTGGTDVTTGLLNGKNAFCWPGTNGAFFEAAAPIILPDNFTTFHIVQFDGASSGLNVIFSDPDNANRYTGITAADEGYAIRTTSNIATLPGLVRGCTYLIFVEWGLNNFIEIPGVGTAVDAGGGSTSQMCWGQVGSYYNGGLPFHGKMTEIGLKIDPFTAEEKIEMANYAADCYNAVNY